MYQHGESANGTLGGIMKRLQLVCLLGFLTVACRDIADPRLRRGPLPGAIGAAAGGVGVAVTSYWGGPPPSGGGGGAFARPFFRGLWWCRFRLGLGDPPPRVSD